MKAFGTPLVRSYKSKKEMIHIKFKNNFVKHFLLLIDGRNSPVAREKFKEVSIYRCIQQKDRVIAKY